MKDQQIITRSLANAAGAAAYIAVVATLMNNAESIFGPGPQILALASFLMLFTLSAAVMASLIFGKPVMLYADGKKLEAVKMAIATMGFLAVFTVLAVAVLASMRR